MIALQCAYVCMSTVTCGHNSQQLAAKLTPPPSSAPEERATNALQPNRHKQHTISWNLWPDNFSIREFKKPARTCTNARNQRARQRQRAHERGRKRGTPVYWEAKRDTQRQTVTRKRPKRMHTYLQTQRDKQTFPPFHRRRKSLEDCLLCDVTSQDRVDGRSRRVTWHHMYRLWHVEQRNYLVQAVASPIK